MSQHDEASNACTHALDHLIAGHQRFRKKYSDAENRALFEKLVSEGQKPRIMVIACSDSRVDPSMIFDSEPGELFVVRNVANLVPPCERDSHYHGTSAALEFAVQSLCVEHIVVLGHSHCGGIRTLMLHAYTPPHPKRVCFISRWMRIAKPAEQQVLSRYAHLPLDEQAARCEEFSLITSLKNLSTFPWIAEKTHAKQLCLHAWHFDLQTSSLRCFDSTAADFVQLGD